MLIGLIPARGGSKGIPGKNLMLCGGKPLLAWTAQAARASGVLDRVILSTDNDKIAETGRLFGLEVPFLRPPELAADDTPMLSVMAHALHAFRADMHEIEGIVLLQPTSPFRRGHHIAHAVELFRTRNAATVVSVVACRTHSSRLTHAQRGRHAAAVRSGRDGPDARQDKATLFARNGPAVLIVRPSTIDGGHLYGDPTYGYEMNEVNSIDIDTPEDLRLADHLMRTNWQ